MHAARFSIFTITVVGLVACNEPLANRATAPLSRMEDLAQTGSCPGHATHVVATEGELESALQGAEPGDTIAISGTIAVDQPELDVATNNLTITCATPGSGLAVAPGATPSRLLVVLAPAVTVTGLRFDARGATSGAYLAFFDGADGFASNEQFIGNQVTCGAVDEACVYFALEGAPGVIAASNVITNGGVGRGMHLEGVEGGVVTHNTVVGADTGFGGIVISGGGGVDVANDTVRGAWTIAMLVNQAADGVTIEQSAFSGGSFATIRLVDLTNFLFRGNTVTCTAICFEMFGSAGARVIGNRVTATGAITGIDVEPHNALVTDGTTVDGNTIQALSPSGIPGEGGIHVSTGAALSVTNNIVLGPWVNSVALTFLNGSTVDGNRLIGSAGAGIAFTTDTATLPITFMGDTVTNNVITAWSSAGISIQSACRNLLAGNVTEGRASVDVLLTGTTGANRVVASARGVVDQGAEDCDGDGIIDPNVVGR